VEWQKFEPRDCCQSLGVTIQSIISCTPEAVHVSLTGQPPTSAKVSFASNKVSTQRFAQLFKAHLPHQTTFYQGHLCHPPAFRRKVREKAVCSPVTTEPMETLRVAFRQCNLLFQRKVGDQDHGPVKHLPSHPPPKMTSIPCYKNIIIIIIIPHSSGGTRNKEWM
jgi:hypothetical protein